MWYVCLFHQLLEQKKLWRHVRSCTHRRALCAKGLLVGVAHAWA
jgi:hypothetical protein